MSFMAGVIPSSFSLRLKSKSSSILFTDERAGAEIVYGKEACDQFSAELMKEIGFPSGVLPTGELVECGRVRATGFVWWKCKAAYEHFSVPTNSKTSYAAETTAYVEKGRMKKMTRVKTK
ncbi:hypothetical protein NE237_009851 [Protea cynaroides]|uniref:Uncharacterized protein n=1 Tax=Protea cynaroides TaxID=273540 RepID=A0A9Q0KZE4_9MAGN|nr:hypothetical protein NE237_009851 [Protea cynaroides]